jgi:transposase
VVERFINTIKPYRRIFSRFDTLDSRYLGFLQFASTLIWLRYMSTQPSLSWAYLYRWG